jgi:hypothetical protein
MLNVTAAICMLMYHYSYTVSVQAWVAGVYKLAVTLHGEHVDASPYTITVAPAQVYPLY